MSRRRAPNFGGLLSVGVSLLVLLCRARALRGIQHAGDFRARGMICLRVDLQEEFDRTVRTVREVLGLSDPGQERKLNHTIYAGLLNRVVGLSVPYPAEVRGGVPEVVRELEEAGFVSLAKFARKDLSGPGGSVEATLLSKLTVGSPCDSRSSHIENGKHQWTHCEGRACSSSSTNAGSRSRCQTTRADLAEASTIALPDPRSQEEAAAPAAILGAQQNRPEGVRSSEATQPVADVAPEHEHFGPVNRDGRRPLVNREGVPIIEDDLYWSAEIDKATPKGVSQQELDEWRDRISKQSVRSVEPGSIEKCGRDKNRFIVLEDGSKLCARYRYPLITSMTGELYSYHLARMLGITNLPPLHLSIATTNTSFWRGQGSNFQDAQWDDGKVVMLTRWIEDLDKAYLPEMLVQGPLPLGAPNSGLRNLTLRELTSLLQWSDLMLFDYLIGNFDRLTINLSSVKYYNNSALLRSEIHNLGEHPHTKQLWIVDNECGLLDGYAFLLSSGSKESELHGELQEQLLRMSCVFRRSTADSVRALLAHPDPSRLLTAEVLARDPLSRGVFPEFDLIHKHAAMLRERLASIDGWMQECRRRNAAARENFNP